MARSSRPMPPTCRSGASAPPQPQAAQINFALTIAWMLPCLQATNFQAPSWYRAHCIHIQGITSY